MIAQTCKQDLQAAVRQVKAQQGVLLAYKLSDEMDESVPAPLQAKIRSFKESFAALADTTAACAGNNAEAKALESDLVRRLDANKPIKQAVYDPKKPPQLDHIYGDELEVNVSSPVSPANLLLVEFGFGIECGQDSMLLGYEFADGRWQRVLRWQSGDYDEINGAFGDFFKYVLISQPAPRGWVIAVAHGMPWCTSRYSGFDLDLIQPETAGEQQKVLQHLKEGYVRFEIEPSMKRVPEGFQLRLQAAMLDSNFMTRIGIYRYKLEGDKLKRVQPVANNGRDFVDEWLQVPWSDAQRWSATSDLTELEQIHQQIQSERSGDGENWPMIEYGAVRGCSDSPTHFQVEMTEDRSMNKPPRPNSTVYFQIEEGKNSFTMLSASMAKDPRCKGVNIMPQN